MSLDFDVFVVDPKPIGQMTAAYPDLANPYTLWVAAYDLLGTRT